MREIKFKAYDGGAWIYSECISKDDDNTWWILDCKTDEWLMCSEPQQYTGLKDKNGKEIYEGDILKESVEHGDIITQVVFRDYSWKEKLISSPRNHLRDYFPFGHENVKVIGNIYENQELLEESK